MLMHKYSLQQAVGSVLLLSSFFFFLSSEGMLRTEATGFSYPLLLRSDNKTPLIDVIKGKDCVNHFILVLVARYVNSTLSKRKNNA